MRIAIRAKLLGGFVVVALCTGVLGVYALITMERLNEEQRTMYVDVFGGTHLLARYSDDSWQARSDLLAYLLAEDPAQRETLRASIASTDSTLYQLAREMDEADTDRQDMETLAGLSDAWDAYAAWRDQSIFTALDAGDRDAALASYQSDGIRLAKTLDQAIDAFIDKKREVAGTIEASAETTYDATRAFAIGLSIAAVGLGLLIGFFLSRNIANAVRQVAAAAKGLARGNLEQHIQVRSNDEVGDMAEAFQEMIAYQQEMARAANAIAQGDLSQQVEPNSATDVLGTAFQRMTANLGALIGELRDADQQNRALNAQLEQRVVERTAQLQEQYRRVQEANRLKSEFLANMSHELRTPLNGIIGFSEMLHDGQVGALEPEQHEYVGYVLTSSQHLLRLINDVLDLAKIESGTLVFRPERVDVEALVRTARDELRPLAEQRQIDVQIAIADGARDLVTDPSRLKQVVFNYLSNALKFSQDGGLVTVRAYDDGADFVRLEVEDHGIGIKAEDMGRLFVEFQQLDGGTTKKYAGTGLGLSLTKRILETQGGSVGVGSTYGSGSTFFARLPRIAQLPQSVLHTSSDEAYPEVLIVDDDPATRRLLERSLKERGARVVSRADGEGGLQAARELRPSVIVLDLLMVGMSGEEFLRRLRSAPDIRELPVVIWTGKDLDADERAALQAQVRAVVLKTEGVDKLLAEIAPERVAVGAHGDS
jgi:signal transduction histidine kinase/ActR/RegA family two-component response regulator